MSQSFQKLKIWAEQKHISIPSLFFKMYKQIGTTDEEALFLLHIIALQTEGVEFPTPKMLEQRIHLDENAISYTYQRLIQKGMIQLHQETDAQGMLYERVSLYPMWEKILHKLEQQTTIQKNTAQPLDDRSIFTLLEQELGRLLSPIEIEQISMWMDHDHHTPEIIKEAVKEAVLAGKVSLRYIDRILFEWKKKQFKSVEQVRTHAEQFRAHTIAPKQQPVASTQGTNEPVRSHFYNWLDERE